MNALGTWVVELVGDVHGRLLGSSHSTPKSSSDSGWNVQIGFPFLDNKDRRNEAKVDGEALWASPSASNAAKLKSALESVSVQSWKPHLMKTLQLVELGGVAASVGQLLSPRGPGTCDRNRLEKVVNVVTSVPYVLVGLESMRRRRTDAGKAWGASIVAVGLSSGIFHACDGQYKAFGRKLDYWAIALSTNYLLRAVFPSVPRPVTMAGVGFTPVKPFVVSFVNTSAVEVHWLQRAWAKPNTGLQLNQRIHSTLAVLGLGLFALEDACPDLPLVHAAWHAASTYCTATINSLLADIEDEQLGPRSAQVHAAPLQM